MNIFHIAALIATFIMSDASACRGPVPGCPPPGGNRMGPPPGGFHKGPPPHMANGEFVCEKCGETVKLHTCKNGGYCRPKRPEGRPYGRPHNGPRGPR